MRPGLYRITLIFSQSWPDPDLALRDVSIDPYATVPPHFLWSCGRSGSLSLERGGTQTTIRPDIELGKSRVISRVQFTLKFDPSDKTWHVHDGFLLPGQEEGAKVWSYSRSGILLNDQPVQKGDWAVLRFKDPEGHPIAQRIMLANSGGKLAITEDGFDTTPPDFWEDWAGSPGSVSKEEESVNPNDLLLLQRQGSDEVETDMPWQAMALNQVGQWLTGGSSVWDKLFRFCVLLVVAVTVVLIFA